MAVAGGHPRGKQRLLEFLAGAATAGFLTYGAVSLAGEPIRLRHVQAGLALVAVSGVFLAIWYGRKLSRLSSPGGRQISKRLARAPRIGPLAYGAVLGTGILTIVSTPAVWLGLTCCFAVASPLWGGIYGLSFGSGRALMATYDTYRSRSMGPGGVTFLVINRHIGVQSPFRWWGVAGGLTLVGLVITYAATSAG